MKPILEIQNISKKFMINREQQPYLSIRDSLVNIFKQKNAFEDFWALKDVSFDVLPGDTLGIIGKNGAGKSTLLKILSKITPPTNGKIIGRGRIASLLEVGTGFHPELSGRENIFMNGSILGMKRLEIVKNFDAIIEFAGVEKFIDTPLKHYSSGMQLRLAFAVAAFLENEILVIDEVLAVGDTEFQKKCMSKMGDISKSGRTILFVSHNLGAIKNICNKTVLLKSGSVEYFGNLDEGIDRYLYETKSNDIEFEKYLKRLTVKQIDDYLLITVNYFIDKDLFVPHFGFIIYNNEGNPITGSNPTLENIILKENEKENGIGEISIKMTEPILSDGSYSMSVWFGDGSSKQMLYEPHCILFSIAGMTNKKQYPSSLIGNVIPNCKWTFFQ